VTDERANAQAAALVILERLPAWQALPAERKAAILARNADAIQRVRKRATAQTISGGATGPSGGTTNFLHRG